MEAKIDDKQSLDAVKGALAEDDNVITLSTGVKLRTKTIPPNVFVAAASAFPLPKPPMVMDKLLGRMMENVDDPEYASRVQSIQMQQADTILNVMIVYGTELISVPKGFSEPKIKKGERPRWLKKYSLLGLPIFEDDPDWLYLTWVKSEVAVTKEDNEAIQKGVGRLSGVPEKDVRAAQEFPGSS